MPARSLPLAMETGSAQFLASTGSFFSRSNLTWWIGHSLRNSSGHAQAKDKQHKQEVVRHCGFEARREEKDQRVFRPSAGGALSCWRS